MQKLIDDILLVTDKCLSGQLASVLLTILSVKNPSDKY